MRGTGLLVRPLALVATALLLSGCPLFQNPILNVTPKAITFGETAQQQFINIANTGSGNLAWTLEEVARANEDAPWNPQSIAYLSADTASGTTTSELDRVVLSVNRAGLPVGTYNNIGVRINSNGGSEVVPLAFIVSPTLVASPTDFALLSTVTSTEFTVSNTGSASATWQVKFLLNPNDINTAVALPEDFRVSPNPGSTEPGTATVVEVAWGTGRTDFSLLLQSAAGSTVLKFRFGAQLEGLQVIPSPLRLFKTGDKVPEGETQPEQPVSKLSINNNSAITRTWSIVARAVAGGSAAVPIKVTPATGSTAPGQSSKIDCQVTDIEKALAGAGNYELVVSSGDGFLIVPVIVEIRELPIITLSEPPSAETNRPEISELSVLDFGRDKIQAEFWVANTGSRNSNLTFQVEHDDQGVADPLIIDVQPLRGATSQDGNDFFFPPSGNLTIGGAPIVVTLDRTALKEDVEYREIRVVAYEDDYSAPIEAVDIATLQVRVERKPLTIEGAINRARPPFLEKFVFLLRDTLTRAIPTRTPEERQALDFTIEENGTLIDLNETNSFITGPENLRVNLVLMLDYTGSMYNAGTTNPERPLAKGQALADVNAAAIRFLDDLPPSYRVALMYHNDRQQQNRLIKNFTTDRAALKSALANFSQPEALFGVTTIRDALMDAMTRLDNEDAGALPFDDADVRAVVFVTDGRDASSIATASDVTALADDTRTRLYPLIYSAGGPFDAADMITFANDSGGHLYSAGNVTNLANFLGNAKGLTFDPVAPPAANQAAFKVTNTSQTTFTWFATKPADADWIKDIAPSTKTLAPGQSGNVTIEIDPALIGANRARAATIAIETNNGSGAGTVEVQAAVGANPAVADAVDLALSDEPGIIWNDLRNQIVLTYVTPSQTGGSYLISARYQQPEGGTISGSFEDDGVFFSGDVRAGQISLYTPGITEDLTQADPADQVRAEVYVRCDYAPRNVTRFRLRFQTDLPNDLPGLPAGAAAALQQAEVKIELAPRGLLVGSPPFSDAWRLFAEPDNTFILLTDQDNYLAYGAEGNLLKITFTNLRQYRDLLVANGITPRFDVGMRADNQIYVDPASENQASDTKFFLYPGASTNPDRKLIVSETRDVAGPAIDVFTLQNPGIDPETEFAWDFDEDLLPDFNDPFPFDGDLPGLIVVPNPVTILSTQTLVDFDVRNQRLDTFTWQIDPASIPTWATINTSGSILTLAPGQLTGFSLSVDRSGLGEGLTFATLRLQTDEFGTEDVPLTLVVPAP